MKKLLIPVLFIHFQLSFFCSQAQNPLLKMWDRTYGGLSDDEPSCFQQTSDGGYILGGYTYSDVGGDKTDPLKNAQGIVDLWVIKTDSMGVKQWDKDFGGANGDQLTAIQQTADGGFILGGMSASNISGDKTQASYGNWDYWILKLDAQGNKTWDKDFGGGATDQLSAIKQTADGGFILAGSSASDSSGNKSQHSRGALDYWVVKTDANGNLLWDKNFGGADMDKLYAVQQTSDGGYILGGSSWSLSGGDKTESSYGSEDFWMVKIDSLGNKEWDKDFGGFDSDILYSLVQTSDGGFLAGGRSGSDIGGNKTQPLWGGYDYWLVKLDASGNKQWDRSYGGTGNEDEFGNITLTPDSGYLIAGTSYSQISGDKSESNLGQEQSWIIKLDSLFNKQWDKTIFTACHDETGLAVQTSGQCYTVVNTNGPACGVGGYRSQASWNYSRDFWIVKFCDSTYFPPSASAVAAQQLCPGTCTSFLNNSTNSLSWQWSFPGATPDTSTAQNPAGICYGAPGNYDVMLIANNLHGSDTVVLNNFVMVHPYPAPQGITLSGDTLYANAGAASYQWYFNGSMISGATDYFYVAALEGDYNLFATDINGCEVEAAIFGVFAGIHPFAENEMAFSVYPNPVNDKFTIQCGHEGSKTAAGKIIDIKIYNAVGAKIFSAEQCKLSSTGSMDVNFKLFPPGIYFMEVTSPERTWNTQFVKTPER